MKKSNNGGIIFVVVFILILIGVWILNVSQVGPLESDLNSYTRSPAEGASSFQVMDLNMLHGFPDFMHLSDRLDLLADQINLISPDIITLQEVPWTWRTRSAAVHLAQKTNMNYVYLPANGNRWAIFFSEGEAILSKFEIKDVEFKELIPRAGFFEHRVALKATAVTPWGDVHILNTHLTNGDPAVNRGQAQDLAEYVNQFMDKTIIVAGDFNSLEDSPQIKFISTKWIDTYRKTNPEEPGFTCCIDELTVPDADEVLDQRFDFIFLVPLQGHADVSTTSSQIVLDHPFSSNEAVLWVSDHAGILTKFRIIP